VRGIAIFTAWKTFVIYDMNGTNLEIQFCEGLGQWMKCCNTMVPTSIQCINEDYPFELQKENTMLKSKKVWSCLIILSMILFFFCGTHLAIAASKVKNVRMEKVLAQTIVSKESRPSQTVEKPEIFVQTGHSVSISAIAFSPDGKYALSGSLDKTMKLWDVESGREIRIFTGHSDLIQSIAFSLYGKNAVSASGDKTIKLWDITTGQQIRTFIGHTDYVSSVAFAPDGQHVLSGSKDETVRLWDVSTGKEVRTFGKSLFSSKSHGAWVFSVAFSPDGRWAISGSGGGDSTVKIWEVKSGKEISKFNDDYFVRFVAFSPDGKYFLYGGTSLALRSTETGKLIWKRAPKKNPTGFFGYNFGSITITPDGRYVLALQKLESISEGFDTSISVFDMASGNEIGAFKGDTMYIQSIAISPDGKNIISCSGAVIGGYYYSLKLWDIDKRQEKYEFKMPSSLVSSVAISTDGRFLLSGNYFDKSLTLWDLLEGKELRTFKGHTKEVYSVAISPDGNYVASGSFDHTVNVWDKETGDKKATFSGHTDKVKSVAFSPDSQKVVSGADDRTIRIWNIDRGTEAKTITWQSAEEYDGIISVTFSPDGRYILSHSYKEKTLWDAFSGQQIKSLGPDMLSNAVFSPDGKFTLTKVGDGQIKMMSIVDNETIMIFNGQEEVGISVAFSPNGRYVLSGNRDGILKLWDTTTGEELRQLKGHLGAIHNVSFTPDGKYATSGSMDSTTRLWNIANGKEIAKFIHFNNNEWIVITPEGYYNSSLNGHKNLNIRMGMNVYGIDQFYDVFYRPDIVMAKLKDEDIKPLITLTIDDAIKNPPPEVNFSSIPSDSTTSKVKVCYQAKNIGGGIGEVRLFHNGKLIQSDGYYRDVAKSPITGKIQLASLDSKTIREDMRSIAIKSKTEFSPIVSKAKRDLYENCLEVQAVPGENEVSVTAFNKDNTVQSYMKTTSFKANIEAEEPHLYILIVGIDKYNDQNINLKYAVKDAGNIKEKLISQSATLYKPENIHTIILTDKEATKANIQKNIADLSKNINPTDGFILFVAGHGVLLQNQYFMLTNDFNGTISDNSMISSNEIVEASTQIKSLSQLFIFDTCHAGGVDYIVSGLYDARMSVLAKKMGLHIYASANDKQTAMDGYKGNGLFTYTLLDGLNNNKDADKNNDGKVSVVGLGGYSKKMTTDISKKIGHSQTPLIINFGKDYPIYKLQ
jgi:WD40 repeat protein